MKSPLLEHEDFEPRKTLFRAAHTNWSVPLRQVNAIRADVVDVELFEHQSG